MSMKRKSDMDRIIEIISYLRSQVELSNSQNLTDINIYSENFFRDFLNLLLNYNLKNINMDESNAAAIDLGDEASKIAIQVTATGELSKIKKTVTKFSEKKLFNTYDRLIILIITSKKKYQAKDVGDENCYVLDTKKDVWDCTDLIKIIGDLDASGVEGVRKFLESEVKFKNADIIPNEISTFQALIELLSDEQHPDAGQGYIEKPDPQGKIEERFADHTDYLKSEFQDLYAEYGKILDAVRENSEIGHVRLRRLGLHLKEHSDNVLSQCDGDAKEALNKLVDEMGDMLSSNGILHDKTAIRFFLLDELIRCNVFPNKENIVV